MRIYVNEDTLLVYNIIKGEIMIDNCLFRKLTFYPFDRQKTKDQDVLF